MVPGLTSIPRVGIQTCARPLLFPSTVLCSALGLEGGTIPCTPNSLEGIYYIDTAALLQGLRELDIPHQKTLFPHKEIRFTAL